MSRGVHVSTGVAVNKMSTVHDADQVCVFSGWLRCQEKETDGLPYYIGLVRLLLFTRIVRLKSG